MPELRELINAKNIERLREEAVSAVSLLPDTARYKNGGHGGGRKYIIPATADGEEVGEPIARYVHTEMLRRSEAGDSKYPFHYRGFLTSLLDDLGLTKGMGEADRHAFTQSIRRVLERSGWGRMISRHRWGLHYAEKPFRTTKGAKDDGLTRKDVVVMDKRVAEESDKPVKSSFGLGNIRVPDSGTKEDLVDFVRKVKGAYDALAKKYEQATAEVEELREQLEQFHKDANDATDAFSQIAQILAE